MFIFNFLSNLFQLGIACLGFLKNNFAKVVAVVILVFFALFISMMQSEETIATKEESAEWTDWSAWSTTYIESTSTREVEQEIRDGYNMVVYVTQEDAAPHNRNFRNHSIKGDFYSYGARSSYGEKRLEYAITKDELSLASSYAAGALVPSDGKLYVGGLNKSTETAYVFPIALDNQGRYYPLFIKEDAQVTAYRYRDKL